MFQRDRECHFWMTLSTVNDKRKESLQEATSRSPNYIPAPARGRHRNGRAQRLAKHTYPGGNVNFSRLRGHAGLPFRLRLLLLCRSAIPNGPPHLKQKSRCCTEGDVRSFSSQNAVSQQVSGLLPPYVLGTPYKLGSPRPPQSSSPQHAVPGFSLSHKARFPYTPLI